MQESRILCPCIPEEGENRKLRQKRKKILIAVDGSDQSFETVRYLGRVLPGDRTEVTLFHVMNWMPESFWDFASDSGVRGKMLELGSWKSRRQGDIEDFMDRASRALDQAGYPLKHVTIRVEDRRVGIARDILREAKNGYAAVALGRRGWTPLKGLILGSIAQKVVNHTWRIPVWIVGGQPDPGKVLVAMDRSEAAVRIFTTLQTILASRTRTCSSFMRFGNRTCRNSKARRACAGSRWLDRVERVWRETAECEKEIVLSLFGQRIRSLEQTGGDVSRIRTKVSMGGSSRAGSVMEEAEEGGYGTIVVGRRGHSRVEEFFMGRVSSKVLHLAEDRAVLVVD